MAEVGQGAERVGLSGWLRRRWWIFSTYYAEGFPYSLVRLMSTAYFKEHGANLQEIGLTSLFGIPWVTKFLWAPLVDSFATKRRWLLTLELAVVAGLVLLGLASATPRPILVGSVVFMLLAVLAATHDIAIDGYYLEALDRSDQARYVGVQSAAYRLALITGGGVIAWACGSFSWLVGYLAAAAVLAGLWLLHASALPAVEEPQRPLAELGRYLLRPRTLLVVAGAAAAVLALRAVLRLGALGPLTTLAGQVSPASWVVIGLLVVLAAVAARAPALRRHLYTSDSPYALAFVDYLDQPRIGVILAFIVTYRLGEALLQNMAYPFLRDVGITLQQYGLAHNTFGIVATITGSIVGGALIARHGLKRCFWPFMLALNTLNLLYLLLANRYDGLLLTHARLFVLRLQTLMVGLSLPLVDPGRADFALVCVLVSVEALGAGLGMAAFTVFVMRTTKASHKAAHFAIGTGLMNVAGTLAGVVSGFVAARIGFVGYFGVTMVAALPSLCLIPFLPLLDAPPAEVAP